MLGDIRNNPRLVGICCSVAAVGFGLLYMTLAGAPERHLLVNGAALAIGLLLFAAVDQLPGSMRGAAVTMPAALALLTTAMFGISADGATRWANIGPILLQPSLILLPMMAVALVNTRSRLTLGSMIVAALVVIRRDRWSLLGLAAAVIAFAVTLLLPDDLPALPYVDGIFYSSFDVHPLAGLAVVGGAGLLIVPAIVACRQRDQRSFAVLFGTVWSAVIAAAALGNYPTPLVGYGGSAVIGYLLSLSLLPRASSAEKLPNMVQRKDQPGDGGSASLAATLS